MAISNALETKRRKCRLALFALLLFSALSICVPPVFATGADVTITGVTDYAGAPVGSAYVEIYLGAIKPFSSSSPYVASSAQLQVEQTWNFSSGNFGYGIPTGDDQTVSIRVWAEGSRGPDNHYGLDSGTTSAAGDNARPITTAINAKYRAAAPFTPRVVRATYGNIKEFAPEVESSQLSVEWEQVLPGTGEDAEVTEVLWRYWSDADSTPQEVTLAYPGVLTIVNPVVSKYYFEVALKNTWALDPTDYSETASFDLAAAGGGGGPFTKSYTFTPVINTFCLPFNFSSGVVTYEVSGGGSSGTITTVRDLLEAVGNVTVFGWYDSVNKQQEGFTVVNSSNLDASMLVPGSSYTGSTAVADLLDSTLVMDLPYQVSVSGASVTISLTGAR